MRSRVRSRPLNAQHTRYADARSAPGWREARSVLGHVASLLFWLFLGVVNAYFTVVALAAFGTILSEAGQANPSTVTPMISGPASTAGSLLLYGPFTWTLALVSAVVEGATWRNIRSRGGFTFLLVLLADIATTVWGLSALIEGLGYVIAGPVLLGVWLGALVLAILPERMLVRHMQDLEVLGD
jgi:hypothetical protein